MTVLKNKVLCETKSLFHKTKGVVHCQKVAQLPDYILVWLIQSIKLFTKILKSQ